MPVDIGQEESFCTPRRAQKCLFGSGDNSCKRNISQGSNCNRDIRVSSEDESDLGPMSPLAFTDRSPCSFISSPGRDFVSPLTTPDKSSLLCNVSLSWDRLLSSPRNDTEECMSPFSSLKKLARAARYSPRYKVYNNNSPKSLPASPCRPMESMLLTSKSSKLDSTENEIIPETPPRSFATEIQNQSITETPRKSRSPEYRLRTPLGSINKLALLPKLHRRKSVDALETSEGSSPEQKENTLKRLAHDQPTNPKPMKLFKANDVCVPKARAALFKEKKSGIDLKNFSLSTKTFYSRCRKSEQKAQFAISGIKNSNIKKRRSLPAHSSSSSYGHSLKKYRFGRINAGVSHGIKRPKPKTNPETLKKEGQRSPTVPNNNKDPSTQQVQSVEMSVISERVPSPEIDENKRFFKTNKTIRQNQSATVTVNNKIKLKVADGKIVLNQKRYPSSMTAHKCRAKATNVSYDATDLAVDEPEVEATLEQDKVANILKILEDDWADDDYDTMETLTVTANSVSPSKLAMLPQDAIMSPASELSNMTSTMNIKDTSLTDVEILSQNKMDENNSTAEIDKGSREKYFPLFTKGYSASNNIFEETDITKPNKTTKKNMQWQLSVKGGGGTDQYQLDAGQKHFGATQCPECNIVYQLGDPEDENAHLNYHNSIRILKFQGWKTERVMMEDSFTSSRIILVEPHDPKQYWKKVSEILNVVDRDLGLADMKMSDYHDKKVFLYIHEKNVLGVLVAEHIKTAYRMIPELIELDCCTAEGTPTKCGINVVWTAMSHRRQGIATKLINILRAKFFYGYVMSLDDIAFSTPSPSGKIFAEKYTKTRNFKVYS